MRDSRFSPNKKVKKGKFFKISFWRVGGFLLTVSDTDIRYRRAHDVSEREYSRFGIFNLKITHFFHLTLTFTSITLDFMKSITNLHSSITRL